MVIHLSRRRWSLVLLAVCVAVILALWLVRPARYYAGGVLHKAQPHPQKKSAATVVTLPQTQNSGRFQRPSQKPPYPNPYSLSSFTGSTPPLLKTPLDTVLAYYGVLREASNMLGYSGGCGTIGDAGEPYPYAYQLLTNEAKKTMSQQEFIQSFEGIGHITLLQVYPLPISADPNTAYYMAELETILGKPDEGDKHQPSTYFGYYTAVVTLKQQEGQWKIHQIDYRPEDFLCAPYHGWDYDAENIVSIVYMENLRLFDRITSREQQGGVLQILAEGTSGGQVNRYRLDFVRLTNGYDQLIGEYIQQNGGWQAVNLLPPNWQYLKMQPAG